jgi:hypothetical protein
MWHLDSCRSIYLLEKINNLTAIKLLTYIYVENIEPYCSTVVCLDFASRRYMYWFNY